MSTRAAGDILGADRSEDTTLSGYPVINWKEKGEVRAMRWRSERGVPPPAASKSPTTR
jgi:hypothetical protein